MAAERPLTLEQDAGGPAAEPIRASTGIEGLDGLLGGGLLRQRMYVIEGAAGAGKTTPALQFMLAGRAHHERGLWITTNETPDELRGAAHAHGWSLEGIDVDALSMAEYMARPEQQQTLFRPSHVELGETMRATPFRSGRHDMVIETGGLRVFPRVLPASSAADSPGDVHSTGVASLDALRSRRRQHDIRQLHAELQRRLAEQTAMQGQLHASEQGLRQLNETLEQRVTDRTAALAQKTQRLQHEIDERQHMQEALVQREKLAALGTLLANVAHELNNPLAVATVQLDNLQEAWGAGAWTEDFAVLRQAVDRCTSVVQSFLALARQEPRCARPWR